MSEQTKAITIPFHLIGALVQLNTNSDSIFRVGTVGTITEIETHPSGEQAFRFEHDRAWAWIGSEDFEVIESAPQFKIDVEYGDMPRLNLHTLADLHLAASHANYHGEGFVADGLLVKMRVGDVFEYSSTADVFRIRIERRS